MSDRSDFTLTAADGVNLACYEWPVENAKAAIVIVHGLAEHAARYGRFAGALNAAGIAAVAMDLRGHGQTVTGGIKGWFAKKDGWRAVLADIRQLTLWAQEKYPGRPLVLFGHSMGSMFAAAAQAAYGAMYRAVILSAVNVDRPIRRYIGPFIAGILGMLQGMKNPATMADGITIRAYNRQFRPIRTNSDWLNRDPAEVDRYVNDENCGFICTGSMYVDMSLVLLETVKRASIAKIPKDVPIFILSGGEDPAGMNGKAAAFLEKRYRAAGLDVAVKVYESARHDLLNETNRDEVTADILGFLDRHLP